MDVKDFTAGTFEQQLEYKSFLPNLIHREWVISSPEVQSLLGQADRALGELNAFAQLVPDIEFFIRMYVVKEANQSTRIEGTQTNIEDAFKDLSDVNPDARDDWHELQNYIAAINFAIGKLEQLPLSNRLLRDTHAILLRGARGKTKMPGEFRTSQNWIGVSLKNAAFIPPHHNHVENLMSDLEKFLHDEQNMVPPLIKIAIAHYQFETIHPFLDGNGRLGRLLISLFLASEKLLVRPALYLSDYFERNKTAYIDHLMAVRQGNHLQAWLVFFLHGVAETANRSTDVFRKILAIKTRLEREVLPKFSHRRQANAQALVKALYSTPVVQVWLVEKQLGLPKNTATSLVADFVKYGVLQEITGQRRNRVFVFREYLDLFKEQ
jgi:Fic family protein